MSFLSKPNYCDWSLDDLVHRIDISDLAPERVCHAGCQKQKDSLWRHQTALFWRQSMDDLETSQEGMILKEFLNIFLNLDPIDGQLTG